MAASAAESTASVPSMLLWLGTHTKETERVMEDREARRVRIRVTGGWKKCTLKMADSAFRESVMVRKH